MRTLHRLLKNTSGISAVEFAFIAPVIVLIYFACIELSMLMIADRKVTSATSTLGDLVARDMTITNGDLTDIYAATDMIFQPNVGTQARMRISSLYDDGGIAKVRWSDARGTGISAYPADQIITIPAGVMPPGGTLIMSEVSYDHSSSVGYFIKTKKTLGDVFYLRPRRTNEVLRDRS